MKVKIKLLDKTTKLPTYSTSGSACMDLYANIPSDILLESGERMLIPTGISVEVPEGYYMQVSPRSGLGLKNGITFPNSPGIIDSDYRGEVGLIVQNLSKTSFTIKPNDRIGQCMILPYPRIEWEVTSDLSNTDRSSGGFGSTGI